MVDSLLELEISFNVYSFIDIFSQIIHNAHSQNIQAITAYMRDVLRTKFS